MTYEEIMHIGFIFFASAVLLYLVMAVAWSWIKCQLLKPICNKQLFVFWGLGWPMFNIFRPLWRDWQDQYQIKHPQRRRGERDNIVSYKGLDAIPDPYEDFASSLRSGFYPARNTCSSPSLAAGYGKSLQSGEGFDGPQSDFSVASSSEGFVAVSRKDLLEWASEWASENDPQDGTDVITPFDRYLYS